MSYRDLQSCILDLEKNKQLLRLNTLIDPYLEAPLIQRLVYSSKGPAVYFANLKGSKFPAVSNLFGTKQRAEFIFRHSLDDVRQAVLLKAKPHEAVIDILKSTLKNPLRATSLAYTGLCSIPKKVKSIPVLSHECSLKELPQIHCWPKDGGAFITLPQVFSLDPERPKILNANLGMYRIQISGNQYEHNEVGLHYQIHRSIGIHHSKSLANNEPLKVSIFVGGPPAHTLAAVMPMPEGLSELLFAGMLARRRFRYADHQNHIISADADFCIVGEIDRQTKEEGPFGDHLGYYSLKHQFPVMTVKKVFHKSGAVWPFTVVGRPPQEDTVFGEMIHEITGAIVPSVIPGVEKLHAVDVAGVHPLLLAVGSERYVPYQKSRPQELLTQANAILGFNQCSLAKYLWITDKASLGKTSVYETKYFLQHMLERVDWSRDLHFQTKTTIDTLDYSGEGLNQGSKVVIAATGTKIRELSTTIPKSLTESQLPFAYACRLIAPGILAIQTNKFTTYQNEEVIVHRLLEAFKGLSLNDLPLIILCDDAEFISSHYNNFLWACFTSSNPSHDIYGVDSFVEHKHWGCRGPLVIDARFKPHMAPPLLDNSDVMNRVKAIVYREPELQKIITL